MTRGKSSPASGAQVHVDGRRLKAAANGRACVGKHVGPVQGVCGRRRAVERREVSLARVTAPLLVALAFLAGCGGEGPTASDGTARLWVTRDRGSDVLVDATVPAGQTLLRALRSQAEVKTRYGGGFVQSIEGVEGNLRRHQDWFWFVNGLIGDRSASSYRLRDGDIAWWDYRDWSDDAGYARGRRRRVSRAVPARVRRQGQADGGAVCAGPARRRRKRRARLEGRRCRSRRRARSPANANLFVLATGAPRLIATLRSPGAGPTGAVQFTFAGSVEDAARR